MMKKKLVLKAEKRDGKRTEKVAEKIRYFIIYKPFGVICQFTSEEDHPTLASLFDFPKDVYPVGRLDTDSEGLLIISNDKELNNRLLNPDFKHKRTYLVQVEGDINEEAILMLEKGVTITIDGKNFKTLPSKVVKKKTEPRIPERNPPIRFRQNIPTSWIELSLIEGKNRQVRRMTAKVGFPTLRLLRIAIERLSITDMKPGEVREMNKEMLYGFLFESPQ